MTTVPTTPMSGSNTGGSGCGGGLDIPAGVPGFVWPSEPVIPLPARQFGGSRADTGGYALPSPVEQIARFSLMKKHTFR